MLSWPPNIPQQQHFYHLSTPHPLGNTLHLASARANCSPILLLLARRGLAPFDRQKKKKKPSLKLGFSSCKTMWSKPSSPFPIDEGVGNWLLIHWHMLLLFSWFQYHFDLQYMLRLKFYCSLPYGISWVGKLFGYYIEILSLSEKRKKKLLSLMHLFLTVKFLFFIFCHFTYYLILIRDIE